MIFEQLYRTPDCGFIFSIYCLVGSKRKGKRMLSKYILDRYTCCPSPLSLIIMYVIRQSKTDS
ncbi:hypothetical protein MtrunA17_Chr4g0045051 [Medicago truncatula]|uniref:Uncharacterized protein n=1 Tax=Medicago truncatula TaxID=3880 RepID=A0A396I9D4_MEDTR|nr:hypothetical protein MtrunA17_Chr4g0045051 [Medicago truncatula]